MKYAKPSVKLIGCARDCVRGGGKPNASVQDSDQSGTYMTHNAYEADE